MGEYRRFAYPVCMGDEIWAPSPLIDKVWHHHIMATKAYFDDFCPQVLRRVLHHSPCRPAPIYDGAYLKTLEADRREFGELPNP